MSDNTFEDLQAQVAAPPYDVLTLASLTRRAYDVLKPWHDYKKTLPDNEFLCVNYEVEKYVKALNYSVQAALCGFDLADQAIIYVGLLREGAKYTQNQRAKYANSIQRLAKEGYTKAESASEGFRGVRRGLGQAIEDVRINQPSTGMVEIGVLFDGIGVLEQFGVSVRAYYGWWDFMVHRSSLLETKPGYPSLDLCEVTRDVKMVQWKILQGHYTSYTTTIGDIKDIFWVMGFNGEDDDLDGARKSGSLLQKWWDKMRRRLAGDEEIHGRPSG